MAIATTKRELVNARVGGKPLRNKVCIFWLQGRCRRNPCQFLHRDSTSETEQQPQLAPLNNVYSKQPKKLTWRNPNYDTTKRSSSSSNEGGVNNNTSSPGKSSCRDCGMAIDVVGSESSVSAAQSRTKVVTAVRDVPKKSIGAKAQPKQCKYWVTGNCVHGDKCKNMHSWFCGSGFTMLGKLEGHTKAITGISLLSGLNKLYTSSKDGTVRVLDCHTGKCDNSVTIGDDVGCLVAEGSRLFAGLHNGLKAWDLQNQTEFSLSGPVGSVCSIVVDGNKVFAGVEDGTIMVWKWNPENNNFEQADMLKGHEGAVCSLVIGAGRLYSGSKDCTVKVWDLQNLQCLQTLYGHTRDVMAVICWDRYLLSASLDKTLKVWGATGTGAIEVVHELKQDHELVAICGIHDAEAKPILLCSFGDSTVRLYDLPTFRERGIIFSKRQAEVIQIGINGLFFTGDSTGEVSVWTLLGKPCSDAS